MQGDLVAKFAYPICKMDTGFLYVFKEQSHPGRLILAHDKHISEMIELTDEERNAFCRCGKSCPRHSQGLPS